jgi:hypothetical protein
MKVTDVNVWLEGERELEPSEFSQPSCWHYDPEDEDRIWLHVRTEEQLIESWYLKESEHRWSHIGTVVGDDEPMEYQPA